MKSQQEVVFEHLFTKCLQSANEQKYDPNIAELGLIYRVMCDSYNPQGYGWALFGAATSFIFFASKPQVSRGMLAFKCLLSGCYAYELSWIPMQQEPCRSFVSDLRSVKGSLKALVPTKSLPNITSHSQQSMLEHAINVLTLDRTVRSVRSCLIGDPREVWLLLFRRRWFQSLERVDSISELYWVARVRFAKRRLHDL